MVFSSTIFLFCFLPLTLAGYYLLDRRFKNIFLLVASLLFYAWGEPKFVFVMIGSILVNHVFALLIDRRICRAMETGETDRKQARKRAQGILVLMVIFNLSLFFVYKYLNFTIANINAVGSWFGRTLLPQTNIALPIGISFFTFQAMSYVFDVYYGRGSVQKNPLNTMLYVALFPQLIAGPIVRYETVAEEITNRKETAVDFAKGVRRFILGLAKKAILANSLAIIADRAFGTSDFSNLTVLMAWFSMICYMLQLYFDFSGYSDMAIGLGLMFGFHFDENFNYPYIARSVSEFWRRWHISLGSWFRDYLFLPLSGSRWLRKLSNKAKEHWGIRGMEIVRTVVPTIVVWFCNGVWHGAAWTYILCGSWYGFILTLDAFFSPQFKKWTKALRIDRKSRWFHAFQNVRTLFLVLLADVLFRSDTMSIAIHYFGCLFGFMGNRLVDSSTLILMGRSMLLFAVSIFFSVPIVPALREKLAQRLPEKYGAIGNALGLGLDMAVFVVAAAFTVTSTYNPFIYFQF